MLKENLFCSRDIRIYLRGCTMTLAGTNDWAKFQSLKILTKLIDTEITKHTETQTDIHKSQLSHLTYGTLISKINPQRLNILRMYYSK